MYSFYSGSGFPLGCCKEVQSKHIFIYCTKGVKIKGLISFGVGECASTGVRVLPQPVSLIHNGVEDMN